MTTYLATELSYLFRMVLSAACGGAIGWERSRKGSTVGMRTHMMLAVTFCVFMLVSKYGFGDIATDVMKVDAARLAAGAISCIGFMGAGIIFVHRGAVVGLTTSAGLISVVGIGLAIGAGMIPVGIMTTVVVYVLHVFHKAPASDLYQLQLELAGIYDLERITDNMKQEGIAIKEILAVNQEPDRVKVKLIIAFSGKYEEREIIDLAERYKEITKIEVPTQVAG